MAKGIIKNKFHAIELTPQECFKLGWGCPEGVICCECNGLTPFTSDNKLYYVAVLNDVMDAKCFEEYVTRSKWYEEDARYERNNINDVVMRLSRINAHS